MQLYARMLHVYARAHVLHTYKMGNGEWGIRGGGAREKRVGPKCARPALRFPIQASELERETVKRKKRGSSSFFIVMSLLLCRHRDVSEQIQADSGAVDDGRAPNYLALRRTDALEH